MSDSILSTARAAVALAAKQTEGPRQIARYNHGGGRICGGEQDPSRGELKGRTLIADLYQEADRELVWHACQHHGPLAAALIEAHEEIGRLREALIREAERGCEGGWDSGETCFTINERTPLERHAICGGCMSEIILKNRPIDSALRRPGAMEGEK
jgi:hypothetical protein